MLFWISLVLIALTFVMIVKGWVGYLPDVEELENPIDRYATQVISSDNVNMGTFSLKNGNRVYANYSDLSPYITNALVATEDARFEEHSGIDAWALVRAVVKLGHAGGGSTISQQLAKQLYSEHASNVLERIFQKPIEWVIAVQLERYYTKQEIINMYLNQFDFLYNAVGIQSACWVYFGKKPKDVTVQEAAALIGMCKNPSYFNPIRKPERVQGRRNVVLDLMQAQNFITKEQCEAAKATPLVTDFHKADHKEGVAPYFREYLRLTMSAKKPKRSDDKYKYDIYRFADDSLAWETNPLYGWCHKNKKKGGSYYNIAADGLKIYTTIDSRMQKYAEEAVTEHVGGYLQPAFFREKAKSATAPFDRNLNQAEMDAIMDKAIRQTDRYRELKNNGTSESEIRKIFNTQTDMQVFSWAGIKDTVMTPRDSVRYMKMFLQTGFMAMDSHTGAVKAYVGGINFQYFQYDMVNQGRRQIGSTVKPFLYSLAMESGFTPCSEVLHVPQTIIGEDGKPWTPRNTVKSHPGENVTVGWGLQNSDNWVTAYLMGQMSPYTFKRLLLSYGLSEPIVPVPALCLGSCDASVGQMVSGYTAFDNAGLRIEPIYVTRIEDRNGNILASFAAQSHEIISESASYQMLSMLQGVMNGGTGGGMRGRQGVTVAMGGKTGTTQSNSDCWFVGFTPSLVGGCWVGGSERSIHFNSMNEGQGARAALPVMGIFLKKVFADPKLGYSETERFKVPERYSNPCAGGSEDEDLSGLPTIPTTPPAKAGKMDDIFN
ncbi:MAG: transglycosylase domain-containing protein [Candidatus Symbiothrix sp.]|nr:transglycosylase domain-containing protein [Candidatus Symbiothrix sp.]